MGGGLAGGARGTVARPRLRRDKPVARHRSWRYRLSLDGAWVPLPIVTSRNLGGRGAAVCFPALHHCPASTGHLVGQRDRRDLARPAPKQVQQPFIPASAAPSHGGPHHWLGPQDEQLPRPVIAAAA